MKTGYLCLNGYSGHSETEVEVIGETPKRYRIKAITRTRLAGENRWLNIGEIELVPKYAMIRIESNETTVQMGTARKEV